MIPNLLIPTGNTVLLTKNWDGSNTGDEALSPIVDVKHITCHKMSVNHSIAGSVEYRDVSTNGNTMKSGNDSGEMNDKEKNGIGFEEFVPGVGFSFLRDVNMNHEEMEDKANFSELVKGIEEYDNEKPNLFWNEEGNLINSKE